VTVNADISGNIELTGDEDYFKFVLSESRSTDIYYTTEKSVYMKLYDSSAEFVAGGNHIIKNLPAGTYYVQIYQVSNYITSYTLRINTENSTPVDDHGNTMNEATVININSDILGTLETDSDQDYFKFILSESKSTDIYYIADQAVNISLYNSSGAYIAGNNHIKQNLSAGTYYVRIYKSIYLTSYTLRINDISSYIYSQEDLDLAIKQEREKYDPNGDGKIGLEEVIYYLKVLSNIK
jgi:hypothetical protein